MGSPEQDRIAWIISGIPGAGKSTVARLLAKRLARAVHIEGDRLQEMIARGAVLPGQEPRDEEARQISLCIRNQCLLARSFAEAGFTPVLDYVVVSRACLAEYRLHLSPLSVRFVVLAPGASVALQRDRDRPEKTVAAQWVHLKDEMNRELGSLGSWIDNAAQSPEQTVEAILMAGQGLPVPNAGC